MGEVNWTHMFQVWLQQHVPPGSESVEHINEYQMNAEVGKKGEIILLGPNVVVRK